MDEFVEMFEDYWEGLKDVFVGQYSRVCADVQKLQKGKLNVKNVNWYLFPVYSEDHEEVGYLACIVEGQQILDVHFEGVDELEPFLTRVMNQTIFEAGK